MMWLNLKIDKVVGATPDTRHKIYANEVGLVLVDHGEKLNPPIAVDFSTVQNKYEHAALSFRHLTLGELVKAIVEEGAFDHKTSDGKLTYTLIPSIYTGDTVKARLRGNDGLWGFLNVGNRESTLVAKDLKGPFKVAFGNVGIDMLNTDEEGGIEQYMLPADPAQTLSVRTPKRGTFTVHGLESNNYACPGEIDPHNWHALLRNVMVKGTPVHFSPAKELAAKLGICYKCLKRVDLCGCAPPRASIADGPSRSKRMRTADISAIAAMRAKRAA